MYKDVGIEVFLKSFYIEKLKFNWKLNFLLRSHISISSHNISEIKKTFNDKFKLEISQLLILKQCAINIKQKHWMKAYILNKKNQLLMNRKTYWTLMARGRLFLLYN